VSLALRVRRVHGLRGEAFELVGVDGEHVGAPAAPVGAGSGFFGLLSGEFWIGVEQHLELLIPEIKSSPTFPRLPPFELIRRGAETSSILNPFA